LGLQSEYGQIGLKKEYIISTCLQQTQLSVCICTHYHYTTDSAFAFHSLVTQVNVFFPYVKYKSSFLYIHQSCCLMVGMLEHTKHTQMT